jgi:hypothetical protein
MLDRGALAVRMADGGLPEPVDGTPTPSGSHKGASMVEAGSLRSDSTAEISGVSTPRADVPLSTTPSQRLEAAEVGAVQEAEAGDLEVEAGDRGVELADLEVEVETAARSARSPDRH